MSLDFQKHELSEFCTFSYGKMPKKDKIIEDETKYPIFSGYQIVGYYDEYNIDKNELIVIARGVGGTGDVKLTPAKCYLTNLSIGFSINQDYALTKFLYYYFQVNHLGYLNSGSAQPQITINDLKHVEVPLPPIDIQSKIIKIIDTIDKKIEAQNLLNEKLAQLIKYIYINWFEEFEPFKNNDFYDTKLGKIPVGWNVKPLQDFIKFQEGPGIRNWQYVEEDGINFLNIRCIQNNDLTLDTANMISKEEANGKYAHFMLNEWDLVISSSGTLGRYAIIRKEHLPLCLNTSIIRFTPLHSFDHYAYIYSYLTSRGFYHYLLTMGSGSVQLNFGPTHLKQIDLIVPPENILKKYNDIVFPIINEIVTIKAEISKLTKLRYTLLRKLIAGEIDVSKINGNL